MVTRRAVLKGTAAVSIGAIAAAHGAVPAEAASFLDVGYGQLTGGAIGGFSKHPDAFQIAVKFDKTAAELFYKEQPAGGVAVFLKLFDKHWLTEVSEPLDSKLFPDLKTMEMYFSKLGPGGASFFLKDKFDPDASYLFAKIEFSEDGDQLFYKPQIITPGDID